MNWAELQSDISNWASRNFGDSPAWQPMLGMVEEVGEFMAARHAHISAGNALPEILDALGDQTVYVLNLCEKVGIDFGVDIAGDPDNMPQHIADGELVGVLGLSCRAILKNSQGIRGYDLVRRRDHLRISISMWYRWACHQARYFKADDLLTITQRVWAQVRKRDWVKHPEDAPAFTKQEVVVWDKNGYASGAGGNLIVRCIKVGCTYVGTSHTIDSHQCTGY